MKSTSIVSHNGGHTKSLQVTLRRRLGKNQEMNGELLEDISSKMRSGKTTQVKMRKTLNGLMLMISVPQKHKVGGRTSK